MGGYDVVVGMVNGLLKDLDIDVPVALLAGLLWALLSPCRW